MKRKNLLKMYQVNILLFFLTISSRPSFDIDQFDPSIDSIDFKYDYYKLCFHLYRHDVVSDNLFMVFDQKFIVEEIRLICGLDNNDSLSEIISHFPTKKTIKNSKGTVFDSLTQLEQYITERINISEEIKNEYNITNQLIKNLNEEAGKEKCISFDGNSLTLLIDCYEMYLSYLNNNIEFYSVLRENINLKENNCLEDFETKNVRIYENLSKFFSNPNKLSVKLEWDDCNTTIFYVKIKIRKYKNIIKNIKEKLNRIRILLKESKNEIKDENYGEIFNKNDFIEQLGINVFIELVFTMCCLCDLFTDIKLLYSENLEKTVKRIEKNENNTMSTDLFNLKILKFKEYFTNDNLKKFFYKNVKNNTDLKKILLLINKNDINENKKMSEITEKYCKNLKLLIEKITNIKDIARKELNKIIQSPTNFRKNYNSGIEFIDPYLKDTITYIFSFYETTYNFYYSEYIRVFCSYSLYNKLFSDLTKLQCNEKDNLNLSEELKNFKEKIKSNFNSVKKYLNKKEIFTFTSDHLKIPLFLYLNRLESEFFKKFFTKFDLSK